MNAASLLSPILVPDVFTHHVLPHLSFQDVKNLQIVDKSMVAPVTELMFTIPRNVYYNLTVALSSPQSNELKRFKTLAARFKRIKMDLEIFNTVYPTLVECLPDLKPEQLYLEVNKTLFTDGTSLSLLKTLSNSITKVTLRTTEIMPPAANDKLVIPGTVKCLILDGMSELVVNEKVAFKLPVLLVWVNDVISAIRRMQCEIRNFFDWKYVLPYVEDISHLVCKNVKTPQKSEQTSPQQAFQELCRQMLNLKDVKLVHCQFMSDFSFQFHGSVHLNELRIEKCINVVGPNFWPNIKNSPRFIAFQSKADLDRLLCAQNDALLHVAYHYSLANCPNRMICSPCKG